MLSHCNYSKTKLIHNLSRIIWYLKNHAKKDAEDDGHVLCGKEYEELEKSLEMHLEKLRMAVEGLSREGKYH